jgi:hypothetical protein
VSQSSGEFCIPDLFDFVFDKTETLPRCDSVPASLLHIKGGFFSELWMEEMAKMHNYHSCVDEAFQVDSSSDPMGLIRFRSQDTFELRTLIADIDNCFAATGN